MVFTEILEMLQAGDKGLLATCLACSPSLFEYHGKRWIWQSNQEITDKKSMIAEEGSLLLPGGLTDQLQQICLQVLEEGHFWRGKIGSGEDWLDLMIEPILPIPRLIILGGGHVGQSLAQLAHLVEWTLVVVDDRPVFANSHLYPVGTEVICDDFSRAIEKVDPTPNDFIVIVTRGHQYDRICLEKLAGRKFAYLGMIGSRRRVKGLFEELVNVGIDPRWLERVYSPIGLDIGAETPGEIGVSILAQLIDIRRKGAQLG